jgi:4-hydroxymandelate oxidase
MKMQSKPVNLFECETQACACLDKMVFEYYAGGANDNLTLADNRAAFERLRLRPRMLVEFESRQMNTTILGDVMPAPLLIAPMAFMAMAHPDGEIAAARASAARGIRMITSTMSNYSLEEIAAATETPKWFQLYVYQDRDASAQMVIDAEAAGYQALVLTIDTPIIGQREADVRNRFHLPNGLVAKNLAKAQIKHMRPTEAGSALTVYSAAQRSNLTWKDITWLRELTKMPVLVKGVLRDDDAKRAIDYGAAGIVVSNHGGRQLDGAVATMDALPEIVEAVNGAVDILVDGGVRRGTDILKAIALGAKGVLLGRPVLWGLALGGEAGVVEVLDMLLSEFDLAMALCGCNSIDEITPDLIFRKHS